MTKKLQARVGVAAEAAVLRVPARAQHRRDLHRRAQERDDGKVVILLVFKGQGTGLS